MKTTDFITEGATDVLYHKTGLPQALDIITTGEFKLSSSIGNDVESSMALPGYPYYLSCSRSKAGDYVRYVGSTAVMFVLDGQRIASNYKVKPVDYWEGMWRNNPERTSEAEDRIFSKKNTISSKYVTEVHVLIREQHDIQSENARKLLIASKTQGIKAFVYNDEAAWKLQDTRKALTKEEFANLLSGRRKDPSHMPRPVRGQGASRYGRSAILDWMELIHKNPGQELSKTADKLRYNLQYYGDTTSQLKNDFFNAKRPSEAEYPLVVKLGDYMTKNKLDFAKLSDMLKNKWAAK